MHQKMLENRNFTHKELKIHLYRIAQRLKQALTIMGIFLNPEINYFQDSSNGAFKSVLQHLISLWN